MAMDWSSGNQSGNQTAPSDTPSGTTPTAGSWASAIAQAVAAALGANTKGSSDTSGNASQTTNQNQASSQSQPQQPSNQSSSQPPRPDPSTVRALQAARLISSATNPQDKVAKIRSLLLPVWRNLSPQIRAMVAHSLGYTPDQISAMAAVPLQASWRTPEIPAQETPGATPAREIPVEDAPGTLRA